MSTSYSWEGKGRYGSFRLRMNVWVCTVQVKLWNPSRTRAIPERFCSGDSLRRGAISSVWTFTVYPYTNNGMTVKRRTLYWDNTCWSKILSCFA